MQEQHTLQARLVCWQLSGDQGYQMIHQMIHMDQNLDPRYHFADKTHFAQKELICMQEQHTLHVSM